MSSDRSMVSSAADCCGKPQPVRSMGNSIRSHSEQRGCNMCTKGLLSSRGFSLADATLAAAAFAGLSGTASASVIYQDSFGGNKTTPLNGAAPTVHNGPSSTWTASSVWADSGYSTTNSNDGRQNAYLSFTPTSGQVYTLTAGLDMTGEGSSSGQADSNYWAALGFITTPATTGGWGVGGASPWVQNGYNGIGGSVYTGPSTAGGQGFANTSGVNTYSMILNTGSPAYSYQVFLTNSAVTDQLVGSGTFSTNPAITAVGIEDGYGVAHVSKFSLTSSPVPEPATLGLVAVGGLGLLLLKRRKAV